MNGIMLPADDAIGRSLVPEKGGLIAFFGVRIGCSDTPPVKNAVEGKNGDICLYPGALSVVTFVAPRKWM